MKECFINIEVTKSVLSEDRTENSTFMTSLDIIQEVMNVPMCALTSFLKYNHNCISVYYIMLGTNMAIL